MSTSPEQPAALRDGDLAAPALVALGLGPRVAALLRAAADGVPARAADRKSVV